MKHRTTASTRLKLLLVVGSLAALVLLGRLVSLALAQGGVIEFPQSGPAFLQTSGVNTWLSIGDWYTHAPCTAPGPPLPYCRPPADPAEGAGEGGNRPHTFRINVPCILAPDVVISIDLFDPEIYPGTEAIDEVRSLDHTKTQNVADADNATFVLFAPGGAEIANVTYPPVIATEGVWVPFAAITTGSTGCGIYTLEASVTGDPNTTGVNDDNSWKLRVTHPDNQAGSGDEPSLFAYETSFQHVPGTTPGQPAGITCENFSFFVPIGTPSMRLNNFDMDYPAYTPNSSITYFPPGGGSITGTRSGGTVWNQGSALHPPPGGDDIPNPEPGWWRAQVCINDDNQYIFEPEGLPYCTGNRCAHPEMALSTAAEACRDPGQSQLIDYTIDYTNVSTDGAAISSTLTTAFMLPPSTTFESSTGATCQEVPAGSGTVTCSLPMIIPATQSDQVVLSLRVDPAAPATLTLTGTTRLEYEDNIANVYPPVEVTLVSQIPTCAVTNTPTATASPTATATATITPTQKKEEHEEPKTPTPTPPPPPPPTLTPLPPAPPVVLLPETGVAPVRTVPAWPFVIFPALGLLVGWAVHRGRNRPDQ